VVTYNGFPRGGHVAGIAVVAVGLVLVLAATAAATSRQPPASGGAALFGTTNVTIASSGGHRYRGDSRHMGDRILRPGMRGHDVRVLQAYLSMAGYQTTVDGQFGPTTKSNVIDFQHARRLPANGLVTWTVSQSLRLVVAELATTAPPVQHARLVGGLAIAPSDAPAAIKAVIAAGNRIAFKPYVYGGGHGSWNSYGYDCSGSVSYALHGGNLLSETEDSSQFESYGGAGAGRWITIWTNAGHAYMYVAGLRFDTSAQDSTGGSRWTTQRRSNAGFVERHPAGY
jgi:peptidoglycan hydrolase-like protein with peptidoglycan-binding domain